MTKETSATNVVNVSISDIIIPKRHRSLNTERTAMLETSISEIGLLSPIVITEEFALVAGRHRLEAVKKLGHAEIPCVVMTYNDIDAELAEIDENLVRYELEVMDRALQISRRKKLYELKYPHTKEKTNADKMSALLEKIGASQEDAASVGSEIDRPSFVSDTADKTGRSSTVIRDEAKLGEKIEQNLSEEVIDLLRPTKVAANKRELSRLIDENDSEAQLEIAKKVREAYDNGKDLGVIQAMNELHGGSHVTTSETTGEKQIISSIAKTERVLYGIVEGKDFERVVSMWTEEGQMELRDQLFNLISSAEKGVKTLTKILDGE